MPTDLIHHKYSDEAKAAQDYLHKNIEPEQGFEELWKSLKGNTEFGYARRVLSKMAETRSLSIKEYQNLALCTSKDRDLDIRTRHDDALDILREHCQLDEVLAKGAVTKDDQETTGIAGGIHKRKWDEFGEREALVMSGYCYRVGYDCPLGFEGDYGYNGINLAFHLNVSSATDLARQNAEKEEADTIRKKILEELPSIPLIEGNQWLLKEWWYYATLIEAAFGLGHIEAAEKHLKDGLKLENVSLFEYETTARQLAMLTRIRYHDKETSQELRVLLRRLLKELSDCPPVKQDEFANAVTQSIVAGKIGLGLSGGGFRASFFHLGVLARLAELNILRHVSALSCVSGGSILGSAYYLSLKNILENRNPGHGPVGGPEYIKLIEELIKDFSKGVDRGVRESILGSKNVNLLKACGLGYNGLRKHGALDTEKAADIYEAAFYEPLLDQSKTKKWPNGIPITELNYVFPDNGTASDQKRKKFNPSKDNWRRADKVPALYINATCINTGHPWQFTTTWMGESPYALVDDLNKVSRLRRTWYSPEKNNTVRLGKAVAASAGVPGIFQPVLIEDVYDFDVKLMDGGVYDNQGTASLLAEGCKILILSDAGGEIALEQELGSVPVLGFQMIVTFMERIRQMSFSDVLTRTREGRLRGCLIAHSQSGMRSDPINAIKEEDPRAKTETSATLNSVGIRPEFQKAITAIRVDLDRYNHYEANALMALGYQVTKMKYDEHLKDIIGDEWDMNTTYDKWPFQEALEVITNPKPVEGDKRDALWLAILKEGKKRFKRKPIKKFEKRYR